MKRIVLFISILVMTLAGCQEFLDVNQDPDQPVTSTPDYLLPPVLSYTATSIFDHGEAFAYFTQQLATYSGFNRYKDRWDYVTANRIAQWRRHYHDISVNAKHMISAAKKEKADNYVGVGKILYAFSTQRTTDIFGDMPYYEALTGNPSPSYDPQQDIYDEVLIELDEAIELLNNVDESAVRPMTAAEDNVFAGDLQKWISFAYAIKARTLLHLTPNVNENYSEVINAADKALENWTDVTFAYPGSGNPLQVNQWGPSAADPGWDFANNILANSAPGSFMLENVLQYDAQNHVVVDPRTAYLMEANEDGEYLSIMAGEGKDPTRDDSEYPDLFGSYITRDDAPMFLFREEELHFIKAEALFNNGESAAAYQSFLKGIEVNMDRCGVTPQEKADFMDNDIPQNGDELLLRHIMMQKYAALWLEGEVWTDMRRYNYDDQIYLGLERPQNLAIYWDEDNPDEWIERLPYDTETEEIYNKPTLDSLGAYQNPEWLKKPMFWATQN